MTAVVIPNTEQVLVRVYGNREPIGMQLLDMDGTAINVTGLTIVFKLVRLPSGLVVVSAGSANLDSASTGKVSYNPSADYPVGEYAMYFLDTTSTPNRRWPYDGAKYILRVIPETQH